MLMDAGGRPYGISIISYIFFFRFPSNEALEFAFGFFDWQLTALGFFPPNRDATNS